MKNIVLLSGGLDSAVLLYGLEAEQDKADITTVFFNYGQKAYIKEKASAGHIAASFGVRLRQINICSILKCSRSSLLEHNGADITEVKFVGRGYEYISKNTEVEFRNGIMLSACISLAMQLYP